MPITANHQSGIINAFFVIDGDISLLYVLENNLARIFK